MNEQHLDGRSVLIPIAGKLIGSAARRLWEELETLRENGIVRVVLDLRNCRSIDSLGGYAIERAVSSGLSISLVTSPRWSLEDFVGADLLRHTRIERFASVDDAVAGASRRNPVGKVMVG